MAVSVIHFLMPLQGQPLEMRHLPQNLDPAGVECQLVVAVGAVQYLLQPRF
jgi:hypothetical protein